MLKSTHLAAALLAATGLVGVAQSADAAAPVGSTGPTGSAPAGVISGLLHPAHTCTTTPALGHATCGAVALVGRDGLLPTSSTPPATALTPQQLRSAYNLNGTSSGGRTVAIVDAYGYSKLESDLATYRSHFGLPACSVASGCLTILNQSGSTSSPPIDNAGWDQEQALDVDAVSAACPDCKILMVQASSTSFADLGAAEQTAAAHPGVVAISNSYGGDDAADATYGAYYNHPGIAVTASTGDDGYQGGSYPASSSYVTAVGGTSLVSASNARGWSESVWSGAGAGCSTLNQALPAAASFDTGCAGRAMADVSAAADPSNGGLATYGPDSLLGLSSTWSQVGGTSESSPIIAAIYALSGSTGSAGSSPVYANSVPYAHAGSFNDVTTGNDGTCPTTQWCTARTGWDGPTGLGTPNGPGGL